MTTPLPTGSWVLVKIRHEPEQFMFLHVDPEKVGQQGYVWSSSEELEPAQAENALAQMELDAGTVARILVAARAQFAAAADNEH